MRREKILVVLSGAGYRSLSVSQVPKGFGKLYCRVPLTHMISAKAKLIRVSSVFNPWPKPDPFG